MLCGRRAIPNRHVATRDDGGVHTTRPSLRLIVVSAATLLAITVNAAVSAAAPAASKPTTTASVVSGKAKPKSKAVLRRSASSVRRNATKVAKAGIAASVLEATLLPSGTSTIPPTSLPPTTAVPTTTMPAPVTTTTNAVASFEVVALNLRADAMAGSAATFSIVIAQRGEPVPVSLSVIGLPSGTSASVGPNPATGQSVIRIAVPSNAIVTDYPLRILGSNGSAQSWANVTLGVLPAATTTTTTTAIDGSSLAPSFGFTVISDGKTLVTGGQVQYDIVPMYDTGYNGSIEYFVSGLPDGVWFGFSQKVTTTKTVLWLSSTVPMKAGTFPFTITGVSKGLKKFSEVTVKIG